MSTKCRVDGCDQPHRARGYCAAHYNQAVRQGELKPKKPSTAVHCLIDDCVGEIYAKNICKKHYMQALRRKKKGKLPYVKVDAGSGAVVEEVSGGDPPRSVGTVDGAEN